MKKRIKALIIDDERYSREELLHLLEVYDSIQVVGAEESATAGLAQIVGMEPDVIFLDIEMPKMSGMELAKVIQKLKKPPLVVFATAYPNFAAEAFRYQAIDYLLKPFDEEQLAGTVQRIERALQMTPAEPEATPKGKLAVEGEKEIVYLSPSEMVYISREENSTHIYTENQMYEIKLPLKELEQRLKDHAFVRIHKSFLVNLDYIQKLIPWFNGAYHLELMGRKETLPVSRNYVKTLRDRLEL